VLLAACQSAPSEPVPSKPVAREAIAGYSVGKAPIHYWLFGNEGPFVYYLASIHGNETAGTPLLKQFMLHLMTWPHELKGRRVVVVPLINPDGVKKNRRRNAQGIDLNRDFRHFSAPETQALGRLMRRYPPALVVSCHQPLACVDYDGPAADLAIEMSRSCGLPVKKLGSRHGSLGEWAERTGIPVITLEMPRSDDRLTDRELGLRYGKALLAALAAVK